LFYNALRNHAFDRCGLTLSREDVELISALLEQVAARFIHLLPKFDHGAGFASVFPVETHLSEWPLQFPLQYSHRGAEFKMTTSALLFTSKRKQATT
jgi:hypothetical protein